MESVAQFTKVATNFSLAGSPRSPRRKNDASDLIVVVAIPLRMRHGGRYKGRDGRWDRRWCWGSPGAVTGVGPLVGAVSGAGIGAGAGALTAHH